MLNILRTTRLALFLGAIALGVVGCGDSSTTTGSAPGTTGPFSGCETVGDSSARPTATVGAQLGDYVIVPAPDTVGQGAVRFSATNIGQHFHELVIVRGASAKDLPRDADGSMAEDRLADFALVGEIEEFPPATACEATFDLEPGSYVLLCNLVEDVGGKKIAHFKEGMWAAFTVT